ncbi:MAG: MoaD/ThiS family protein [Candidatus Krumholzibacteria bacterium]
MIRIELLLFAQLKEAFAAERLSRGVREGTTVERVAAELLKEVPDPAIARLPLMFAVNEQYVAADYRLSDGDCLALITPFAGG